MEARGTLSQEPTGLVRVLAVDGTTAGTGFLVSDDGLIATCTHVLGAPHAGAARVVFRFSAAGTDARARSFEAAIDGTLTRPVDAEDVTFLRLRDPVPEGVEALALGSSRESLGCTLRTFGFPSAKPVEGMAGEVHVTGRTSEGGFEVLQLRSNEVSLGYSGAPVWDQRGAVVGMVMSMARPDRLGRLNEVAFLRPVEQLIDLCPTLRPRVATPYRGLAVFEEEHVEDYFGREDAIRELVAKLAAHRFVAVVGVSGSGKSSLVRAGLTKGLEEFAIPGLATRRRCLVTPGSAPMLDLVLALGRLPDVSPAVLGGSLPLGERAGDAEGSRRDLGDQLARVSPAELADAIRQMVPSGMVLVVDQFERLFTEARDVALRDHFISTLVATSSSDVKTLITLRADFYGLALAQPGLDTLLRDGQLTLLPMTDDELREAIEQPARRHRRRFQPGLVQRLVADVRGRPGDLPLLEFALAELWTHDADTGVLSSATYDEQLGYMGPDGRPYPGVQGAIANRAEKIWSRLGADERIAARRVFLSVIGTAPAAAVADTAAGATSRRAWMIELSDVEQSVARRLADERLLTIGRDHYSDQPTIEVAHEALIRAWPLLSGWSAGFRDFVRWRDRELAPRWQQWIGRNRDPESLLPSGLLEEALRWQDRYTDELSAAHRDYIQMSDEARKQQATRRETELAASKRLNRRLRTLAVALATVVLVAGVSAILAVRAANRADSQRRLALSRSVADQALAARDQDIDLAALLSLEAFRLSAEEGAPSIEARRALLTVLQSAQRTRGSLTDNGLTDDASRTARIVAFSPNNNTLASAHDDGSVRLWDVRRRSPLGRLLADRTSRAQSIAFSPDGMTLATGGFDGTVRLWDVEHRRPLGRPIQGHTGWVNGVAFSPNGTMLASVGEDGTVQLWDVDRHSPLRQPRALARDVGTVRSVAFSPDGATLALAIYGGASVSPERRIGESVVMWDLHAKRQLARSRAGRVGSEAVASGVPALAFSPDGKTLASAGGGDKTVLLWDVSQRRLGRPIVLRGHDGSVESVAFSPDGKTLVSSGGGVRLWDVRRRRALREPVPEDPGLGDALAFSPDGATLAIGMYGGAQSVRLWDVSDRHPLSRVLTADSDDESVAFSPDGQTLAAATDRTVTLWDVRRRRQLGRPLIGHNSVVLSVAFSADGQMLASAGGEDKTVRLWHVPRRAPGGSLPRPVATLDTARQGSDADSVYKLAFSPDGKTLASGTATGVVQLRDVSRRRLGRAVDLTPRFSGTIIGLGFSPDGKTLVAGSIDSTLRLWDVSSRRAVGQLNVPVNEELGVDGVAMSPDGKTLASFTADNTVQLWAMSGLRPLSPTLAGHTAWIQSIAFSPDGKTLATAGGDDKTVRLWDVRGGQPLGQSIVLRGRDRWVQSVAFSRDGVLASAGDSVRLWDPIVFSESWPTVRDRVCPSIRRSLSRAEWADSLPGEAYGETCG